MVLQQVRRPVRDHPLIDSLSAAQTPFKGVEHVIHSHVPQAMKALDKAKLFGLRPFGVTVGYQKAFKQARQLESPFVISFVDRFESEQGNAPN